MIDTDNGPSIMKTEVQADTKGGTDRGNGRKDGRTDRHAHMHKHKPSRKSKIHLYSTVKSLFSTRYMLTIFLTARILAPPSASPVTNTNPPKSAKPIANVERFISKFVF